MRQPRLLGTVAAGSLLGLSFLACTSKPPASEPSTYQGHYNAELEEERGEFVRDTQERIDELDEEMRQLQARIDAESPYVSTEQRAEWRQELFELEQDRRSAQAELNRARTATFAEWREMRSTLGAGLDRIEAGVDQLGYTIRTAFAREQTSDEAAAGSQSGAVPEDNSVDDHVTPGEPKSVPAPRRDDEPPPAGTNPYK